MVLKQILRDVRKEWTWALFYTIVATMTVMAILFFVNVNEKVSQALMNF